MLSRRYSYPSWFDEMERLQQEINRLFNRSVPGQFTMAPAFPAVNVWSSNEGAFVTAELPGINSQDIEITVVGQTLTLSGVRPADEMDEEVKYHRQERGHGKFTRSIELPFPVEADKVEAAFDKGILEISLPRAEADKPRKISVKSA